MQWNSAADFFAMGGYALYVWGSFGVTVLALGVEVWLIRRRRAAALQAIRDERLQGSGGPQ
ncbi:MAG: heme exporter protein CcmD [Rhodoferax sp.]